MFNANLVTIVHKCIVIAVDVYHIILVVKERGCLVEFPLGSPYTRPMPRSPKGQGQLYS